MPKKIISIVIGITLIVGCSAFAQETKENIQNSAAKTMVRLGLIKGYAGGQLGLEKSLTRAEFSMIITRMLGYDKTKININSKISFKDLPKKHWAYTAVRTCATLGYIKGYSNKKFKPSNKLTYAEAIAIMVRVLNQTEGLKGKWPDNYINRATNLGILKNMDFKPANPITRGDISVLVTNALTVQIKTKDSK